MNQRDIKVLISLISLVSFGINKNVQAQTNASPYSMIGIGDLNYNNYDRSTGLGGAGFSLSSGNYMYMSNPASFVDLQDHYFSAELAANFKYVNYKGQSIGTDANVNSSDLQFQKLSFGIKGAKFWGIGFGLKPYSSINYNNTTTENVVGSNIIQSINLSGNGGLHQFYWSNAFRLFKGLNLGLESSFLFGSQQLSKTTSSSSVVSSDLNTTNTNYFHKIYFKGGLQYHTRLSKDVALGVGLVGAMRTRLHGIDTYDLTSGNLGTVGTIPVTLVSDSGIGNSNFYLPQMLGGGVSVKYKNAWTFNADYQRQNWSSANNSGGLSYTFANSQRISGGVEYAKMTTVIQNGNVFSYEKYYYQLGGFYNEGNLIVRDRRINDFGVTMGFGVNSKYTPLGYLFNVQVGSRGTTANSLIKENYIQIGVVLSYRDLWHNNSFIRD
ncbi:hypothetical protein [Rhizosphaericola mali]|uniref:Uncharacterized protein n=1 Tax=Rhizosphaericola mali TaxID=2545455 RepID=A0A5P2G7I5_9BACT|nr:hypothetical protein [Rhizosphaericola mali]QES87481.1 hypothetical protein E0W69_001980 [Rhizosphaericola mali]